MVTKFAKFHFIKLLLIFICRRVFEVQKFVELRKLHDEPKLDDNKINTHIQKWRKNHEENKNVENINQYYR